MATKTLAHRLAEYACALRFEDLSKDVVHEVKRRVIDSLGCALGAWNEEPCVIARKVASDFSAKNGATIIGTDHKAPPDWAAFATGCCIRYFDYNDTYLSKEPAHPSDNIAAAFRQARVGELSHWKGVAFANAARHGVYSAFLARAGMTGPAPIFEGQMGFEKELGVSLGKVGDVFVKRPDEKIVNEGTAAMILNTSIKYWPAEYHSQSAIEAALFLREQLDDVSQIASVNIESHDASVDIIGSEPEKWRPETRETADHSLPYITAIALIDGKVTDQQFQPSRFTDPAIWKFLENVKVTRNAELSSLYPGAVANIVHVTLKDGRTLSKRVDYPLGNAKNPVSDVELERKFLHLVAPALGRDHCARILQCAWALEEQDGVHHLMKLLRMR